MNVRILAVGLSLAVLTWLAAWHLVRQDYEDEAARTRQIHGNLLLGIETYMTNLLQDADDMLVLMERTYRREGKLTPVLTAAMSTGGFSRFVNQASIIDAAGNPVYGFVPANRKVNVADRAYFKAHADLDTRRMFIGPVVTGRVTGQTVFHLSRRINKPDGSFGGMVVIAVSTDYFDDFFRRLSLENYNYVIVGRDYIVRATSGNNRSVLGRSLEGDPIFQAIGRGDKAGMLLMTTMYMKESRFVSFRVMERYDLVCVATQLAEDALARFRQRQSLYYGAAGAFSVFLLLMMYLLYQASRRQEELRQSVQAEMERAEYYLDMAGAMMVAIDAAGRVTMLNRKGTEILGYAEDELIGKDWFDTVIPPEHRERVRRRFEETLAGKPLQGGATDMEALARDGSRHYMHWLNSALYGPQGEVTGFISSGVDITERRQLEAELTRLANTDALTGLSNRRSLMETAKRDFHMFQRYHRPLSLGMLDIDHFKQVNDTYGHDAGDLVLMRLADVFRSVLRKTDLYGRFGGEEFLFLMPETPADRAFTVAERLRAALAAERVATPAGMVGFTVSIGVATADPDLDSVEELIKAADNYLYKAKKGGRNRVVVGPAPP